MRQITRASAPPGAWAATPIARGLQLAAALTALGAAWMVLIDKSVVQAVLVDALGAPARGMLKIGLSCALGALTVALLLRPGPRSMLALAGWMGLSACIMTAQGQVFAYGVVIPAHAARIGLPLVWLLGHVGEGRRIEPLTLARFVVASTFIAHGCEALLQHPKFVAYIIGVGHRWHLWAADLETARIALFVIGAVDVTVGVALIAWPTRGLALYMAAWGAITALCRVFYADLGASYEVFIRAAHCALPLSVAASLGRASAARSLRAAFTPAAARRESF